MLCVPAPAVGVYVTEQVELVVPGDSVHGLPLTVPVPEEAKATVPDGADFVPDDSVSDTVAVQVVEAANGSELGAQLTLVEVCRFVTVTANGLALLSRSKRRRVGKECRARLW